MHIGFSRRSILPGTPRSPARVVLWPEPLHIYRRYEAIFINAGFIVPPIPGAFNKPLDAVSDREEGTGRRGVVEGLCLTKPLQLRPFH